MKQISYILIFVLFSSALYSSISNTWKWASDYYVLLTLVSIPDSKRSYNPYSQDFFWVSQDGAISIIKNFDYPYSNCSSVSIILRRCNWPKIEYTARSIGMEDVDVDLKIFDLIEFLIKRGEPIDAYSPDGYTALQASILYDIPKLTSLLIEAGADPYLTIQADNKLKGKNSFEFIEVILRDSKEEFRRILGSSNRVVPNQKSLPTGKRRGGKL